MIKYFVVFAVLCSACGSAPKFEDGRPIVYVGVNSDEPIQLQPTERRIGDPTKQWAYTHEMDCGTAVIVNYNLNTALDWIGVARIINRDDACEMMRKKTRFVIYFQESFEVNGLNWAALYHQNEVHLAQDQRGLAHTLLHVYEDVIGKADPADPHYQWADRVAYTAIQTEYLKAHCTLNADGYTNEFHSQCDQFFPR